MRSGLYRLAFRAVSVICTIALAAGCDSPLLDLGEEVVLSASADANQQPVETRDRFSLEDEWINVHVLIPAETAGPEQRDFHWEYFDGEGRIVSANGAVMTRAQAYWSVRSRYRINPEIDAPGLWNVDVYIDGRHAERVSFPVTATANAPLPETPASAGRSPGCCKNPGSPAYQVFFSTGVDEEPNLLRGLRDGFRLGDGRMYVYVRMTNIPNGAHELKYTFYEGDGLLHWRYEHKFESTSRRWMAWVWRDLSPANAPGLWTVDIHLDGELIGSVRVPVDA
jgi:hypothetical protein